MSPPEHTIDVDRGPRSAVPHESIFDQDDPSADHVRPSVDSPPRRPEPSGTPRYAHTLAGPTRRERRVLRKQKRRERSTIVGRHPKTTVLLVVLVLLTPVWASMASAATNPALGPTAGSRLTEWVRDHGGGGIVTWAENTWYTWHAPPKGGKPAAGAIPKPTGTSATTPVVTGPAHLPTPAAIVP